MLGIQFKTKQFGVVAAILICVGFAKAQNAEFDKTPVQRWAATGFNFQDLRQFIRPDPSSCLKDEARFVGCMVALDYIALQGTFPREIEVSEVCVPVAKAGNVGGNAQKCKVYPKDALLVGVSAPAEEGVKQLNIAFRYLNSDEYKELEIENFPKLRFYNSTKFGSAREAQQAEWNKWVKYFSKAKEIPYIAMMNALVNDLKPEFKEPEMASFVASRVANLFLSTAQTPHDSLMSLIDIKEMQSPDKSFSGIGVEVTKDDQTGYTKAANVFEGSPSESAGIMDDDLITAVDGISTKDMPLDGIVKIIRGPIGTKVKIDILRKGVQISPIVVTRGSIKSENVSAKIYNAHGKKFVRIKYHQFKGAEKDYSDCRTIYNILENNPDADGWILDLRGNPGGILPTSVCVSGIFVGANKPIVNTKDFATKKYYAISHPQLSDRVDDGGSAVKWEKSPNVLSAQKPMVVLIGQGSASASEIVSGTLQEYKRAWIVGVRSYGKGTVQALGPSRFNQSVYVKTTTATFHRPLSKISNQGSGIEPDFWKLPKPEMELDKSKILAPEARSFFNPVALDTTEVWKNSREAEIAQIDDCVSQLPENYNQRYTAGSTQPKLPDYQALYAEDILECQMRLGL